jgi:glyoxylase-like metal-dependent hydrolase (beta-lactamase superfamily II)
VSAPHAGIAGIHRIELPLPFELERINLYVVALDRGYLLIDCGMDTPQSLAALEGGLGEIGIGWCDLRIVLLTHMHPDHIGLSQRLRELSGAEFLMHEAEAEHLDSLEDEGRRLPYLHAAYSLGGVPAEMQARMDEAFSFLRQSLHSVTPDRLLKGGERLPSAIGPLTVLLTPGHSPGHVCLYAEESKTLFSGDHILNEITPNIAWHPERDALGDYLASLERIGELEIDRIFPAHGEPFSGHRKWIHETAAHHQERCGLIVAAAADGARTADEMVRRLWTRRLDPIHHHFAVFEVMAHLEYMRRRGRMEGMEREGGMEWRKT